ncbi:hypothetical protein FKM82_019954 [Ascaphus truei]|uniref:sestrin-2 isoform X1 n=1 Tax=Ascaphus truei TaxID=8439 RepID=UPI003F5A3FD8
MRVSDTQCYCLRGREDCYPGCQAGCPHRRVKDRCDAVKEPERGPSAFIPVTQRAVGGPRQNPLGENIGTVMGLHPEYLRSFGKTHHQLLHMDGALSLPERHYVAIMAAARHQCAYLVSLHSSCFLQVGGDPCWLQGLNCAPQKLHSLNDINKILAHRPWLITKDHIQSLLRTGGSHVWSLAELIHAVVLLTHFHSLASFVLGCGIYPQKAPEGLPRPPSPEERLNPGCDALQEVERLVAQIKRLEEGEEEASQEEMDTRFEMEKRDSLLVTPNDDVAQSLRPPSILCFVEDTDFAYIDFTRRGEQAPPTFRAQDYTWEDHGYSLINRLYPEVGQLLDEKFQVVYNLTYHTIATHSDVDTSKLRRAVWNYIHCIYGIRYDDYDYGEVNQLLERSLKVYMKTVTCYPERVSRHIYCSFWRQFKHSEKVHLNLILLEARMQAALLYALRAITRYMT